MNISRPWPTVKLIILDPEMQKSITDFDTERQPENNVNPYKLLRASERMKWAKLFQQCLVPIALRLRPEHG